MRFRPAILTVAVALSLTHVVGLLFDNPLLPEAEFLALALLLAYVLVTGQASPRWVLPAALCVLLVDAARTTPSAGGRYVLTPLGQWNMLSGFETGLGRTWAALTVVLLLLVLTRRRVERRRLFALAALAAVLVTGYAIVRIGDMFLNTRQEYGSRPTHHQEVAETVAAAGLAVLAPLGLALAAIALAAILARRGLWLAAVGAVLLALVALPHMDSALGLVSRPLHIADSTALFVQVVSTRTLSSPRVGPTLTDAAELVAYFLLVVGVVVGQRETGAHPRG